MYNAVRHISTDPFLFRFCHPVEAPLGSMG
jgi:hypothetical protein